MDDSSQSHARTISAAQLQTLEERLFDAFAKDHGEPDHGEPNHGERDGETMATLLEAFVDKRLSDRAAAIVAERIVDSEVWATAHEKLLIARQES